MTVFLPLDPSSAFPSSPSYLVPCSDPSATVRNVVKAILKARRVVVVCGAGISVASGIPDFRSSTGLFRTMKQSNKDVVASGQDLFDISVFNVSRALSMFADQSDSTATHFAQSEQTTSLFCQMIAQLSTLSEAAQPSPFHQALKNLDDRGRLLRVYTQNIDAIEEKSGLSFGVPQFKEKNKPRSKAKSEPQLQTPPITTPVPLSPPTTPRCIPLHGSLQSLHCATCTGSFPLNDYLPSLNCGTPPHCPDCTAAESTRKLVGKRSRGIGKLRPSVVLYNEDHKYAECVGEAVRRDLVGNRNGPDFLLVVGTSLRVPGTKRMVREFSKAVRHARSSKEQANPQLQTPTPSPRRTPTHEEVPMTSAYLNLDFPVPTREWEGVFDIWLQGDAQSFAATLLEEMKKEAKVKEDASERKRKRDELNLQTTPVDAPNAPVSKKRKVGMDHPSPCVDAKKRRKKAKPPPNVEQPKLYIRIPARRCPPCTLREGDLYNRRAIDDSSVSSPLSSASCESPTLPVTPPRSPRDNTLPWPPDTSNPSLLGTDDYISRGDPDSFIVRRIQCGLRGPYG